MKKKILGLSICILLIVSVVPAVESLKGSRSYSTVPFAPLTNISANWTEMQKLLASDSKAGDWFGRSVSLDGDTALIGADGDNENGNWSGSAYVFTRNGTTWSQEAKLLSSDGAAFDAFGFSVSLSGDFALIGAFGDHSAKGSVYVFIRANTTWSQKAKIFDSDGATLDSI